MVYEVIILPQAEQDTDEAILWYESQQKELGIKFYSLLLDKLDELKFNPQYYFNIYEGFRRLTIDPFPYNIIYKIIESAVIVFAVFHQSREGEELIKRRK